jgi:hypothetical protein
MMSEAKHLAICYKGEILRLRLRMTLQHSPTELEETKIALSRAASRRVGEGQGEGTIDFATLLKGW